MAVIPPERLCDYFMKQDIFNEQVKDNSDEREVTFVKRAGTVLGAGAMAVVVVGAVGVYAFFGGSSIPKNLKTKALTTSSAVTQTVTAEMPLGSDEGVQTVSQAAATWRKAGIDEYDLVVETVKATKSTTGTSARKAAAKASGLATKKTTTKNSTSAASSTTTTAKTSPTAAKTSVTTAASTTTAETQTQPAVTELAVTDDIKDCGVRTMYTSEGVNVREEPSLSGDVLKVLDTGAEVVVTGYNSDWYRIKADGVTGFCLKKYLSGEKPADEKTVVNAAVDYTDTEFDMLCYVLQGEVGNCSEASKIAVANVILNRVKSPLFPNSISEVLTTPGQFDAIYGYYNGTTVPSENTIECARRALSGEDNSNGAVYYYAPAYCGGDTAAWFETLTFCTEIDGQRYFK